jgi:hypothetical protein
MHAVVVNVTPPSRGAPCPRTTQGRRWSRFESWPRSSAPEARQVIDGVHLLHGQTGGCRQPSPSRVLWGSRHRCGHGESGSAGLSRAFLA